MIPLLLWLVSCEPKFQSWIDADGDGYGSTEDCDDGEASVNVGMKERCDGYDNDCDSAVDERDSGDSACDEAP